MDGFILSHYSVTNCINIAGKIYYYHQFPTVQMEEFSARGSKYVCPVKPVSKFYTDTYS